MLLVRSPLSLLPFTRPSLISPFSKSFRAQSRACELVPVSPLVSLPLSSEFETRVVYRPRPLSTLSPAPPPPTFSMRFSTLLFSSAATVVFALVGAGALVAADGAVASAALTSSGDVDPALLARSDQGESARVLCVCILRFSGSLSESEGGVLV